MCCNPAKIHIVSASEKFRNSLQLCVEHKDFFSHKLKHSDVLKINKTCLKLLIPFSKKNLSVRKEAELLSTAVRQLKISSHYMTFKEFTSLYWSHYFLSCNQESLSRRGFHAS